MTLAWVLIGIIVVCNTLSDIFQCRAMRQQGEVSDFHPSALRRLGARLVRDRQIWASVSCMALSFFVLLALLSVSKVSFAVPATAASYLLETLLAKYLLREPVDWKRWTGATLVACGVALLAI
jgi:drug/metabolite transporter (DMT)-like permease